MFIVSRLGARGLRRAGSSLLLCLLVLVGTALAGDAERYRVTQKGRAFTPGSLAMRVGERVEIVNDDGELVHHAYLDNPAFSFDTGEQGPGSKTVVTFPTAGTFVVLCGIHPKMKLIVSVR